MKSVFLLSVLVSLGSAGYIQQPVAVAVAPKAIVNTGASTQYRSQDNLGNYAFGYNEDHATGGTFRREVGNAHGQVVGSYGLRAADGRVRVVNYVADDAGFRANIQSNEPGLVPQDPAAVSINKPAVSVVHQAIAPAATVIASAPVVAAPVHAAPIVQAPIAVKAAPIVQAPIVQAPIVQAAAPVYRTPIVQAAAGPIVQAPYGVAAGPIVQAPYGGAAPIYAAAPRTILASAIPETELELVNAYANPAAYGYTLGMSPDFGFQFILRKKKK